MQAIVIKSKAIGLCKTRDAIIYITSIFFFFFCCNNAYCVMSFSLVVYVLYINCIIGYSQIQWTCYAKVHINTNKSFDTKYDVNLKSHLKKLSFVLPNNLKQGCQYRTGSCTGLASGTIYFGYRSIPVYRFGFTAILYI